MNPRHYYEFKTINCHIQALIHYYIWTQTVHFVDYVFRKLLNIWIAEHIYYDAK
jgi:hypothetical protein